MMKTALCVAAAVLGALGLCLIQDAAASPVGPVIFECCENFKPTRIPHKRLLSYTKTIGCSTPAVVFTNKRNMRICTKASEEWVQTAVTFLEKGLRN
ncbi:C-C motif chemokine 5-like [Carcharodon carcharias]|uniref:C-C motif chemokine 5-like n=1 Tax=Carcharodon carcharias TaxID=13397 RepID=UPI001B7E5583|nr:C-C motif chemokine 5-like [Carcharodon carcharias]XP_041046912.1 C-C motif chemokine 5-like [Carcharodon carcharias]